MTDLVRDIYFACGIKYFAFLILSFIVVFAYMMKSLLQRPLGIVVPLSPVTQSPGNWTLRHLRR